MAVGIVEDRVVYPVMIALSACLCEQMSEDGMPSNCRCGIMAGDRVLDYCGSCDEVGCGGQAWVRFVDAYPSTEFPAQQADNRNCYAPLAFTLEVGVVRCAPTGEANGVDGYSPPSMQDEVSALRQQMADMAALRRAIQCCFAQRVDNEYIMGAYNATDVTGGDCIGGYFTVQVWENF
jgi:hypothetical protein